MSVTSHDITIDIPPPTWYKGFASLGGSVSPYDSPTDHAMGWRLAPYESPILLDGVIPAGVMVPGGGLMTQWDAGEGEYGEGCRRAEADSLDLMGGRSPVVRA